MDNSTKKLWSIIISTFLGLIIIVVAIWFFTNSKKGSDSTTIQNFGKLVKNLPDETRSNIEKSLYAMLTLNNEGLDPSSVSDAFIRKDSESQDSKIKGQYKGTFIIDISSLRQSYNMEYAYSEDDDGFDSGYPYLVTCLDKEKLIYGEFNCKNQQYSEPVSSNPLFEKLPYKSTNYTISAINDSTLLVQVMLTYTTRTDKFFKSYATAAQEWLTEQGFDVSNYTIEYRDINNKTVLLNL